MNKHWAGSTGLRSPKFWASISIGGSALGEQPHLLQLAWQEPAHLGRECQLLELLFPRI